MESIEQIPIVLRIFETQKLVDEFPPNLYDSNKKIVYQIACPPGSVHSGQLVLSRWNLMRLPYKVSFKNTQVVFEGREDYFGYERDTSVVEWYLNFAHYDLFCAYGGGLFAQDEMQVAEHPALGSLREALLASGIEPLTVENGKPTPILIKGVERRCAVSTEPNPSQQRHFGLYGNNFAQASEEAIKLATTPLNPPTLTNLIAMEAPACGRDFYTQDEIEYILRTAFTGFSAAKIETKADETVIHTGFWGCGAYGGNRVLMSLLQLIAAVMSQVDRLVFHTGSSGLEDFQRACRILEEDLASLPNIDSVINKLTEMKFEWGISDGN
ncbi:hypothetical protein PN36_30890 [Candidatus Thiomargarita nelsonii]|uniref:PARG catalytic Macro domain-containing protein n=1 Tax=Candidatus Thiomargarita nelsonii TaxID=1003181 RepID=A0A0A6P2X0_9GAMM|nr:hypothetical protein PN36_30890 [Candidatus Thiomargarita nelsonii]